MLLPLLLQQPHPLPGFILGARPGQDRTRVQTNTGRPAILCIELIITNENNSVENMITRISNRYEEPVLRTLASLPEVTEEMAADLDALAEWTEALSAALPK